MKISYRSHSIIKKLQVGKIGKVFVQDSEKDRLTTLIPMMRSGFKEFTSQKFDYYFLSNPFLEAFNAAAGKLTNSRLWGDVATGNYCFLDHKGGTALKILNDKSLGCLSLDVFELIEIKGSASDGPMISTFGQTQIFYDSDEDDNGLIRSAGFLGYALKADHDTIMAHLCGYVTILLFLKFAKVETKFIEAKKKLRDTNCVYKNETDQHITVLDSTWFTTLVKSDAFKVRGHFRLQPKKVNGEWAKELIWIADFEKHGYTRKAGILKNQGDE